MRQKKDIWFLVTLWHTIKNDAIFLYRVLVHPKSSIWAKIAILWLIVYVISPIDIIPDRLFIIWSLDDVAVIIYVIHFIKKNIPPKLKDEILWKTIIIDADKD